MMMTYTRNIVGISLLLLWSLHAYAQMPDTRPDSARTVPSGLRLGAIAGLRMHDFGHRFGTDLGTDLNGFTLGAGAGYVRGRYVWSAEFGHTSARSTGQGEAVQLFGFSSGLSGSYALRLRPSSRLEAGLGIATANHQILTQNQQQMPALHLTNHQWTLSPGLAWYRIDPGGMTFGLRVSWVWGLSPDAAWRYRGSGEDSPWRGQVNALLVQFTTGGLLRFK